MKNSHPWVIQSLMISLLSILILAFIYQIWLIITDYFHLLWDFEMLFLLVFFPAISNALSFLFPFMISSLIGSYYFRELGDYRTKIKIFIISFGSVVILHGFYSSALFLWMGNDPWETIKISLQNGMMGGLIYSILFLLMKMIFSKKNTIS